MERLEDGAVAVHGIVKRAYALQSLGAAGARPSGEEDSADPFSPGAGPCGQEATQLVTAVVENRETFQTCIVFFYDAWAVKMQFLMRHYKLDIGGPGLVALQWTAGEDTEEQCTSVVVAERVLLKKTLQQQPRLFRVPLGVSIEVAFEELRQLPESDQFAYLPPKSILSRDIHGDRACTPRLPPATERRRGKRTLQQATGPAAQYRYTALSDLVNGNTDLYGVVVNASLPKPTGGKDYCMSINVVDETCPHRSDAIPINIFYPSIDQMPRILYAGDIIRFHKLRIQQYQAKIQGLSMARATRYLVLREGADGRIETQTCSASWTFEPSDEKRTRELISWARRNLEQDRSLPPGCPHPPLRLGDLKSADNFTDVVARILLVDDTSGLARLLLWDGSGDVHASGQRVHELARDHGVLLPDYGVVVELTMDSCWPVLQDMGFDERRLTGERWCRLRNVAVTASDTLPGHGPRQPEVLRFREVSSLMLIPAFVPEVASRLGASPRLDGPGNTDAHAATAPPTRSPSARLIVPAHIIKHVPVTPLAEVARATQVPRKYHCLARFRELWPADIGAIAKAKAVDSDEFVYSFAVRIEDASGTLDAIVYGSDADHFLHGIPACDLRQSTSSKRVLEKRLGALLRSPEPHHCCIKSYNPPIRGGGGGGREGVPTPVVRYRLFDTLLQC